jgi:2-polyprenyl-6-methoxyphenol hydroxylase-like FAD-dependent oxidoreductase
MKHMRIAVVGGGPAGLYFAYLWRSRHPGSAITLFEQNERDSTFGFGVVFSQRATDFLNADDPETANLIAPCLESWSEIAIAHKGALIAIDGVGFSSIGRLDLLRLLRDRAEAAGADLRYGTAVKSTAELSDFDLIVGADGVNSLVRRSFEADFGTALSYCDAKFAWFGTTKRFARLTQTFIENEFGTFNAHHYPYAAAMSTFIVECDRATWLCAGFDRLDPEGSRALCERIFAETLDGHPLLANRSSWRNFPWIWNRRWSHRNMVLMGDALHTAHYSIGSGTRLALEDALALVKALERHPADLPAAFERYESERRPIVEKLVVASRESAAWYADFPRHMRLSPVELAYSYIKRSGRVDDGRLREIAPAFMRRRDEDRGSPSCD